MQIVKYANLALRFLLELCAMAAAGYWGFQTGKTALVKILLGIGAALLVAVVWGIFLAPASKTRLQDPWALVLELVIFGAAIAALYSTGRRSLALVFAVVYALNRILLYVWKQ